MQHRREIEGLRALAVIPVVLFHAAVPGFGGGFTGVDVFFVISGFLITATIIEDAAAGNFSLRTFYERRARRLLPALFAVLAVAASIAAFVFIAEDFRKFAQALAASALFGANLLYAREVGYFDDNEGFQPLLHTWSLSVEEQFYLLFPLLIAALVTRRPAWLKPAIGVTLLASLGLAVAMAPHHPQLAFFILPTRAWELMIGAACATIPRSAQTSAKLSAAKLSAAKPWLAIAGLVLIVLGFILIDETTPAPGFWFLLPTCGAALVLLHARHATLAGRFLSAGPLVAIGAASYGIYLWHNPLLAFARYGWFGPLPWTLTAAVVALSFALGFASLRWIERPVRQRERLRSPRALAMASLAAIVLAAGLGAATHLRRLPSTAPVNAASRVPPQILPQGALPFVLYGDSHARQYYTALAQRFGAGALLSESACLSLPGISNAPPDDPGGLPCKTLVDRLVALARERPVGTIYWAQRWERDLYRNDDGASLGNTSGAGSAALPAAIETLARALPPGTRLVLIGNVPTAHAAAPQMAGGYLRCLSYINVACPVSYPAARAEARSVNAALAGLARHARSIAWFDPAEALCQDGQCLILRGSDVLYADQTHLTPLAARQVVARFPIP